MDPVVGLLVLVVTVFSVFPLVRRLLREEDVLTSLTVSFVLGLLIILIPLYIVGILLVGRFVIVSWIIFLISTAFFLVNAIRFAPKVPEYIVKLKSILIDLSRSALGCFFVAAIGLLLFKYFYILSIKAIFDWDAVGLYLPFARRIYETNSIPLYAYDFEPVVLPQGISVLYGWIYSLAGSVYDEGFRFFPLLFVVMTMIIIYSLGKSFGSRNTARIAVIIYSLLPLHDSVFFYASYYPDLCYNALILATFLFMYKYVMRRRVKYCLLGGISLGLSILMKLQTAYIFLATLFIFVSLLEGRRFRMIATYLLSFIVGFLFIYFAWPDTSFFAGLPIDSQILALFFVFGLATLVVIAMENWVRVPRIESHATLHVIQGALVLYGTTALIASIWFLRNFALTGSWLWSSNIGLENYQWAVDFISKSGAPLALLDISTYLISFVLNPFTVPVLGTWVILVAVGMISHLKARKTTLLMICWMLGYWMGYFWSTLHHFELWYTTVDERDLMIFAPFFSLFASVGIERVARHFTKSDNDGPKIYLLVLMGLLALSQSLFLASYGPAILKGEMNYLEIFLGFPMLALLRQTPRDITLSFLPNILCFILLASYLIFTVLFLGNLIMHFAKLHIKVGSRLNSPFNDRVKKTLLVIAVSSLFVAPYISSTYGFSGGNLQEFGQNQLRPLYGGLYTEVASYINNHAQKGDVVLMPEFLFLQYYLCTDIRVIALNTPGNLAALRSLVEANDSSVVLSYLSELHVRYFLMRNGYSQFTLYLSTKSLLLNVVRDPRYFQLITFPNWYLYELI